jgi:hypothetical protein
MAISVTTVVPGSVGDARSLSGAFTSTAGDTTLTYTHGMYDVRIADFRLAAGAIGAQVPKVTHSAGVATVIWDDTLGFDGTFYIVGK